MQNIKVLKEITGKHAHDLEVQNNLMTKTTKYKRNIFKVWKKCNIENKILCIKINELFFHSRGIIEDSELWGVFDRIAVNF